MRTTNNLFRKVHNYTHWKWWFTQFERKSDVLEIFHCFQYFEGFRSMKKWQISKPKIVHWYQVKERHLFFQNLFFKPMGNLAGPLHMSPVNWPCPALTGLIYMRNFSPVSEMRESQRSWERVLAPNLRNKANSRLSQHRQNFQPAYWDLGWKNRDLKNRASPPSHIN